MKFSKYPLAPEIKQSLSRLGFVKPTDIQYKSISPILRGDDVLAIAQTGTGKTAAFAIPILNNIHNAKEHQRRDDGIKCLVMVPTRELAVQITEVFQQIGRNTRVKTGCLFGGVEQDAQIERLQKGLDVLVTTPGRMFDLMHQQHLNFRRLDTLVLDESDHMLDLGFIKDIRDVIKFMPRNRQTLFFSATINEEIKKLAYSLVVKPVRIQISPKDPVSKNVNHSVAFIDMDDKRFFLERLVKEREDEKILVFVRTQVRAERVMKAMARVGIRALTIHGGKEQKERMETMRAYKTGEVKVLIATDVSARGIDIPNVQYVVNYDLPDPNQPENYVHRVGRTGRGREKGLAVSFCSEQERDTLETIQTFLHKEIKVMDIERQDYAATVDFTEDHTNDWKTLMKEQASYEKEMKEVMAKRHKQKLKKKKKKK